MVVTDYTSNLSRAIRRAARKAAGSNGDGRPDCRPMEDRVRALGQLMGMVCPVPEEWKRPPGTNGAKPKSPVRRIELVGLIPPTLGRAAYHGFAGGFLEEVSEKTEATDACVLGHLLSAAGAMFGPKPYVWGGGEQYARVNVALVGPTSNGRKGTGLVPIDHLMRLWDEKRWMLRRVRGLATGEGLIAHVTDKKVESSVHGKKVTKIVPVDKLVWVIEAEFSKVLAQAARNGNILSQVMREAFDTGDMGVLTRSDPMACNGAHISICGHITPEEMKKRLNETEMANGFANRFLWLYVVSDKIMPSAPPFNGLFVDLANEFRKAVDGARKRGQVERNAEAEAYWVDEVYESLRKEKPGFVGVMTARGEAIVTRLSLIYCLLDRAKRITKAHLDAALAVWTYSCESVDKLLNHSTGNSAADSLFAYIKAYGAPVPKTEMHKHGNYKSGELEDMLATLEKNELIRRVEDEKKGPGRKSELWQAISLI